jgi:hypothetical protein
MNLPKQSAERFKRNPFESNRGEDASKRLLPANCYVVDWAMGRARKEKNEMRNERFDPHNNGGDDAA